MLNFNPTVKDHSLWLDSSGREGRRLVLTGEHRGLTFADMDLRLAIFSGATISNSYFQRANLAGAWFNSANLDSVGFQGANLAEADFSGGRASWCNFIGASLPNVKFVGADLRGSCFNRACLDKADLTRTILTSATFSGASLEGTTLPFFQICPEVGGFYAWKKTSRGVIKIYIPPGARRTSSLVSRKCRAEYVRVIDGPGCGGESITRGWNPVVYRKGKIVRAHRYNDDIRIDCAPGIHFFMTRGEAEDWSGIISPNGLHSAFLRR